MTAIDPALIEQAKPHFLKVLASVGRPGDDTFVVAQTIAIRAVQHGVSEASAKRLLDHLLAFMVHASPHTASLFGEGPNRGEADLGADFSALQRIFDGSLTTRDLLDGVVAVDEAEIRERALLEQLIAATRLYDSKDAVQELIAFAIRLRAFAPFNAMILHIQKPGLTYAATAGDWYRRFGRVPKKGTRPLLVLRTMGPVDFVFDVLDTDGEQIPDAAFTYPTLGEISRSRLDEILRHIALDGISLREIDRGDLHAGWIRRLPLGPDPKAKAHYEVGYNRNHPLATQLVTIAHELGHLFLGHLGEDKPRSIKNRTDRTLAQREVEAEMAAYLVAKRNGLTPRSETYLDTYKDAFTSLDLYGVMKAANSIERAMGVSSAQLKAKAEKAKK
jgi:hypothetical protein